MMVMKTGKEMSCKGPVSGTELDSIAWRCLERMCLQHAVDSIILTSIFSSAFTTRLTTLYDTAVTMTPVLIPRLDL